MTSAGIELEWPLHDAWTALVQVEWETSTLRDLGFSVASDDQWLLWGGLRARLGSGTSLELAIAEDLGPFVSPDFSLWVGLSHSFGR